MFRLDCDEKICKLIQFSNAKIYFINYLYQGYLSDPFYFEIIVFYAYSDMVNNKRNNYIKRKKLRVTRGQGYTKK